MGKKEQVPDNTTRSVIKHEKLARELLSSRETESETLCEIQRAYYSKISEKYVTCCMERDPWCCT